MNDGFERAPGELSGKYHPAERRPIETTVGGTDRGPESSADRVESRGAWRDGLLGQRIGVNRRRAKRGKGLKAVRLARRNATGECDASNGPSGFAHGRTAGSSAS